MKTTTTPPQQPALRRVRDGYWRVTAASGVVLGYVEQTDADGVARYRAKRLFSSLRVVEIGEFGAREEAAECLR
ncbi:hypothetical protein [Herbiconiux daphne]|uniref:DNA mismatch repair protein MutT n=1 Tax=Herbiconiux daphne TaxID=2970914 RepID=A0ABT2GYQ0_9MICO|nr:hypothetical protein [Herbiconiux daphne]MCS5733082.1 hypothetical protein [Herbiconiux daphne]